MSQHGFALIKTPLQIIHNTHENGMEGLEVGHELVNISHTLLETKMAFLNQDPDRQTLSAFAFSFVLS